jgi:glycosyltransferase involved in cell wall biosynthesis
MGSTNQKFKKILLLGNVNGACRSQVLIKTLLGNQLVLSIVGTKWYADFTSSNTTVINPENKKTITKLARLLTGIEALLKAYHADAIYIMAMNNSTIALALILKRLYNIPIIVDFYISLYDTRVRDRKVVAENSKQAKKLKALDRLLIEKSDILIHPSKHELKYIADLVGANLDFAKVKILPLITEKKPLANPIAAPDGVFRLCWWGTYIPIHGLDKIIATLDILNHRGFKFRLDIFGVPGVGDDFYKQMAKEMNLWSEVCFHEKETFANGQLQNYLTHYCDLALGIFGDSDKAKNAVANKVIDALAMQLPILTMESLALWEFFQPGEIFTCANSPESIADKIVEIAADPVKRIAQAKAGYTRYLETFTEEQYAKSIASLVTC